MSLSEEKIPARECDASIFQENSCSELGDIPFRQAIAKHLVY